MGSTRGCFCNKVGIFYYSGFFPARPCVGGGCMPHLKVLALLGFSSPLATTLSPGSGICSLFVPLGVRY